MLRVLENVFKLLGDIALAISDLFTDLFSRLGGWFSEVVWELVNVPVVVVDGIISGIRDLFQFLFVPKESFLDSKITGVQQALAEKFDMQTYEQLLNALKSYVEGTIDLGGYIDITMWTKHLKTVKNFIRGFFYPLILISDVNHTIWLLRGTAPFGGGGNVNSDSGAAWWH